MISGLGFAGKTDCESRVLRDLCKGAVERFGVYKALTNIA